MRISDWSSDVCSSDLQTAILGFPVVDRRFRHAVATSQVDSLRASLLLLQHADDLLFCEPCSLHSSVLPSGQTLIKLGGKSGGDRKSVVWGKRVSVRVDCVGRRSMKNKKKHKQK